MPRYRGLIIGAGILGFGVVFGVSKISLSSLSENPPVGQGSHSQVVAPATTVPAGPPPAAGTVLRTEGKLVNFGFGDLKVVVTTDGSRITAVGVSLLQVLEPYSETVAQDAEPILAREVLKNQSAVVEAVSGATYTSKAYAESLQAALDRLHIRDERGLNNSN